MTTYELSDFAAERPAIDFMGALKRLFATLARQQRRYRTLKSIAHLDAVQLKDIGLDADDVADAINGDGAVLWTRIPRLR